MKKQKTKNVIQSGVDGWTKEKLEPYLADTNHKFVRFANQGQSVIVTHISDKSRKEISIPLPQSKNFSQV